MASNHPADLRNAALFPILRDSLGMAMLAAWLNVRPDQIPVENRAHLNPQTMAAWQRVGAAAIAWHLEQAGVKP